MASAAPIDPLAVRSSSDPEPLPVYVVAPVCAATLGLASGCVRHRPLRRLKSSGSSPARSTLAFNSSPRTPIVNPEQLAAGTCITCVPHCPLALTDADKTKVRDSIRVDLR